MWTNQPAVGSVRATATTDANAPAGYLNFDVTSYIQQRLAAGATSVSFRLSGASVMQNFIKLTTSEAASNKPLLVVS